MHPDLPFVDARIRFASGDVDRAAAELRTALDTVAPQDFRPYQGAPSVIGDIAAAANVFAYQGDLSNAAKAIDLADQVRQEGIHEPEVGPHGGWRRSALGDLYAATGGPTASLRQVWQSAAEAGRMVSAEQRKHVAHSGASAAIGLFTGPAADSSALTEYQAMTGESLTKEVRALLALTRGDSTGARRVLAEPDSAEGGMKRMWATYRRPLAAQAYFLLGDYQATLRTLEDFESGALHDRRLRLALGHAGARAAAPRGRVRAARPASRGSGGVQGSVEPVEVGGPVPQAVRAASGARVGPVGGGGIKDGNDGEGGEDGKVRPAPTVFFSPFRPFRHSPPQLNFPCTTGHARWSRTPQGVRGKSEPHRVDCQITPGRRKATDRATEKTPPAKAGKGEKVG